MGGRVPGWEGHKRSVPSREVEATDSPVGGTRWVEARMRLLPPRWIGVGLLLALGTGLGSLGLGYPFLTTHTAHMHWPLVGEVHLPSAALFDLGVFCVVVGSTLLMLTAIAHQSLRARRQQAAADDEQAG